MRTRKIIEDYRLIVSQVEHIPVSEQLAQAKLLRGIDNCLLELDELESVKRIYESRSVQECIIFVEHIKAHLRADGFVKCKICNQTINEIYHNAMTAKSNQEAREIANNIEYENK